MPSVKLPKKSTDTDMTPFVDIAFLILSFFIMATKFKPQEPVETKTPNSVSAQALPENDAVLIYIDSTDRVFFAVLSEKDKTIHDGVIQNLNSARNLGLSTTEMANFKRTVAIGVPFQNLKSYLALSEEQQKTVKQPGIPVTDTINNEMVWWIQAAKQAYRNAGRPLKYLIKGDGNSKYPAFEGVVAALKKNDEFKYNLVTSLENAPQGTELDKQRASGNKSQ